MDKLGARLWGVEMGWAGLMGSLFNFRPTGLQFFFSFRDIIDVYCKVQHRLANRLESPSRA
jgi:hypothetical protein